MSKHWNWFMSYLFYSISISSSFIVSMGQFLFRTFVKSTMFDSLKSLSMHLLKFKLTDGKWNRNLPKSSWNSIALIEFLYSKSSLILWRPLNRNLLIVSNLLWLRLRYVRFVKVSNSSPLKHRISLCSSRKVSSFVRFQKALELTPSIRLLFNLRL